MHEVALRHQPVLTRYRWALPLCSSAVTLTFLLWSATWGSRGSWPRCRSFPWSLAPAPSLASVPILALIPSPSSIPGPVPILALVPSPSSIPGPVPILALALAQALALALNLTLALASNSNPDPKHIGKPVEAGVKLQHLHPGCNHMYPGRWSTGHRKARQVPRLDSRLVIG